MLLHSPRDFSRCLEKVLYLGKQATFVGEASPTKLAPQDRTFRFAD